MTHWTSNRLRLLVALLPLLAMGQLTAQESTDGTELSYQDVQFLSDLALGPHAPPALGSEMVIQKDLGKLEAETGEDLLPFREFFFIRQNRFTTALIDRPNNYEYWASPIRNSTGTMDVWFCGGNSGHDAVFKQSFNASNIATTSVTLAVPHTSGTGGAPILGIPDGVFACANTVIKHGANGLSWPGGSIPPVSELYLMYYECSGYYTDRALPANKLYPGPNQICLAASVDGNTWMKYNGAPLGSGYEFGPFNTTTTVPVVKLDSATKAACGGWNSTEIPGEYVAEYPECSALPQAYGAGQPSAISLPAAGGSREVWLYYLNPKGGAGLYTYLRKSLDGINFSGEELPVLGPSGEQMGVGKVRYFDVKVANHSGVFIATNAVGSYQPWGVNGGNYFNYSFDGVNFKTIRFPPDPGYRMAEVKADEQDPGRTLCMAPGAPNLVADKYGVINKLTGVEMLSGEGKLGVIDGCTGAGDPNCGWCFDPIEDTVGRGSTWGLYLLNGDFGHIAPPEADVCTLYDEQNVRDQYERGVAGTQDTIYWVDNSSYFTYLGWTDFQAKNNNGGTAAYFDVNNATHDRVEACTYGGVRSLCHDYDGKNINKGFAPSAGTKYWFNNGIRYSYGTDATHNFTYLNYGDSSNYITINDAGLWDVLVNQCPSGGVRQPTVCHTYDNKNIRNTAGSIEYVKNGFRYGYSGWCCDANSYLALDYSGHWTTSDPDWASVQATCPYDGLRGIEFP